MRKTVFITGASSGIGKATAILFQKYGWNVVATMRSPGDGKDLRRLPNVTVLKLDVTNPDDITRAVTAAHRTYGSIDVLVNNAGYGLFGPVEELSDDQMDRQVQTNLMGTIRVTREVLPRMRQNQSGIIVNLSSNAGRLAFPFYSIYNAVKFAVEGFSESLSYEVWPFGIRVKVIEPGPVGTDFFKRSAVYAQHKDYSEYARFEKKAFHLMHDGNRSFLMPPEKVARKIYHAVTHESSRLRYPVGSAAAFMLLSRKILPDFVLIPMIRILTIGRR